MAVQGSCASPNLKKQCAARVQPRCGVSRACGRSAPAHRPRRAGGESAPGQGLARWAGRAGFPLGPGRSSAPALPGPPGHPRGQRPHPAGQARRSGACAWQQVRRVRTARRLSSNCHHKPKLTKEPHQNPNLNCHGWRPFAPALAPFWAKTTSAQAQQLTAPNCKNKHSPVDGQQQLSCLWRCLLSTDDPLPRGRQAAIVLVTQRSP